MTITGPSAEATAQALPLPIIDLACHARLDATATLLLREDVARASADGPALILLDISGIRTIDASGVVGLLEVLRHARSRGGDVRLYITSRQPDSPPLDAHLGLITRIYPGRQSAVDGSEATERGHRRHRNSRILQTLSHGLRSLTGFRA